MGDNYRYTSRTGNYRTPRSNPPTTNRGNQPQTMENKLLALIVCIGDSVEENQVCELAQILKDESLFTIAIDCIFQCIKAIPYKLSYYSTLIALISGSTDAFAQQFLARFHTELISAFKSADYYSIKMLLLFVPELVESNIISSNTASSLFVLILETLISSKLPTPQRVIDFYIVVIIKSLLWASSEITTSRLKNLINDISDERKSLTVLQNITPKAPSSDKTENKIDFGTSNGVHKEQSYIEIEEQPTDPIGLLLDLFTLHSSSSSRPKLLRNPMKYSAVINMISSSKPEDSNSEIDTLSNVLISDPIQWFPDVEDLFDLLTFRTFANTKIQLYRSIGCLIGDYPEVVPISPFVLPFIQFQLFPKSVTHQNLTKIEYCLLEDLIVDTIHFFKGEMREIHKRFDFCTHLSSDPHTSPENFQIEPIICQVIFKQFFSGFPLQSSALSPSYSQSTYPSVAVHLAKNSPKLYQYFVNAFDVLFDNCDQLSQTSLFALSDFLAFFVSNFEFKAEWKRWAEKISPNHSIDEPKLTDEIRNMRILGSIESTRFRFMKEMLEICIRISYYERISTHLQNEIPNLANELLPNVPLPSTVSHTFYSDPFALEIQHLIGNSNTSALLEKISTPSTSLSPIQILHVVTNNVLSAGLLNSSQLRFTIETFKPVFIELISQVDGLTGLKLGSAHHILDSIWEYLNSAPHQLIIAIQLFIEQHVFEPLNVIQFILRESFLTEYGHRAITWLIFDKAFQYHSELYFGIEATLQRKIDYAIADSIPEHLSFIATTNEVQEFNKIQSSVVQLIREFFARIEPYLDLETKDSNQIWRFITSEYIQIIASKYRPLILLARNDINNNDLSTNDSIMTSIQSILEY